MCLDHLLWPKSAEGVEGRRWQRPYNLFRGKTLSGNVAGLFLVQALSPN